MSPLGDAALRTLTESPVRGTSSSLPKRLALPRPRCGTPYGLSPAESPCPVSALKSTDDFSELSFRISELAREPRGPRHQRDDGPGERGSLSGGEGGGGPGSPPAGSLTCPGLAGDGDPEQIDFIDSHVPGEEEERGAAEVRARDVPCPGEGYPMGTPGQAGDQAVLSLCCSVLRSSCLLS